MSRPACLLVGLSGLAGAGKDTAADYLAEAFAARGKKVGRIAFADPVRHMLVGMGVPSYYMTERTHKELPVASIGVSYRQMAQTLGTEWGRNLVRKDLWVLLAKNKVADMLKRSQPPHVVLFTDVRYEDEAQAILNGHAGLRGALLRIDRPAIEAVREHSSEAQALHADHTIANSHDLPALRAKCNAMADLLLAEASLEA